MKRSPESQWILAALRQWVHREDSAPAPSADTNFERAYHLLFHHQLAPLFAASPTTACFPESLQRELTEDRELEARAALARLAGLTRLWNDLPDHAIPIRSRYWKNLPTNPAGR